MKKTLLLPLLLAVFTLTYGQQVPKQFSQGQTIAPQLASPTPGGKAKLQTSPSVPPAEFRLFEEEVGETDFETQTVTSLGGRVAGHGNGTVSAIWHFGLDDGAGWPDRGTGYNFYDGTTWGPTPTESFEPIRSGYPSFTVTPNGMECVVSHQSTDGVVWIPTVYTKMPSETEWTENQIPTAPQNGVVWAKIAAGGPDGNTLHVIAVSLAEAFGGAAYNEVDQHLLYYRSLDGGATWDMTDVVLPGLDKSLYNDFDSEAYTIQADGETVAVGVFSNWGDIAIAKSTDNGATWEKTIVKDFPLDKYDEMGYGPGDIPMDPNAPDSISILTTDGSGSLIIDQSGKVHIFFGWMYVQHTPAGGFTLSLGMSGIAYWNEDMAMDEIATIADLEDFDGDMMVTIDGDLATLRYNNSGLTSFPASGMDTDGNMYVVYTAMREDFLSADDQNYRHIFIIKSEDGGATWSDPFDIINEEVTEVPEFIEAAYPAIPNKIGDVIHLTYLQDFVPGQTPDGTPVPESTVMYVGLDKNTLNIVSDASEVEAVVSAVDVFPNPSTGTVQVRYELSQAAEVQLRLVNLLGEQVYFSKNGTQPTGQHSQWLDLSHVSTGVYFVQLNLGNEQVTRKLVLR